MLTNLWLVGGSILLALSAFEVGLRWAGYRAVYETYSKPSMFWVHDPVLGWAHEPGAQGEFVGPRPWPVEFRSRVEVNALGLRGPALPDSRPAGGDRVLALGDSIVAAFEVPWRSTFTALLEAPLSQALDRPVQVLNAGVRGYGTDQSLLYYRHRGRELRPDLVVFFYSRNDPVDNITLHEMRRPFGKAAYALRDDGSLELVGYPVRPYPACSEYRVTARFELERVDGLFSRAVAAFLMIGKGADLAPLDTRPLEAEGIQILSLDPVDGESPEELRFRHDGHYNTEGHARLAAFLAPRLRDLLVRRERHRRTDS